MLRSRNVRITATVKPVRMSNTHVKVTRLENGIRVISERMPYGRSVSIGIWIPSGSRQETPQNNGISHFLEHMLFKGTEQRSAQAIASSLEVRGGNLNASTGKELSVYTALVVDEDMPLAVDVLTDLVQHPTFALRDIAREKKVVLTEINHALEDPEEMVLDYFYQDLYPDHPLGYFIYGTPDNVKSFQRSQMLEILHGWYRPEEMVIAAAGNVDHEAFVAEVRQRALFADFTVPGPDPVAPPPRTQNRTGRYIHSSTHQAHIVIGTRTFAYSDPRKYALVLLDILAGCGMSSRLFQNIREKHGFAYSVYSFIDFMSDTGVFGCYLACDAAKAATGEELLRRELIKLREQGVSAAELEHVKAQARGNIILGLEGSGRRMHKIAENEIYGFGHLTPEETVARVEAVTAEDIFNITREFFSDANLTVTTILPH